MGQVSRVDASLVEELRVAATSEKGPQDFTELFSRATAALELDVDTTAGLMLASPLTINAWASGKAKPVASARPSVFDVLHRVATELS